MTSTVPAVPDGAATVIEVAPLTITPFAFADPNRTAVAPVKPVPVKVTEVPAASGPLLTLSALTVGAAA